MSGRIFVTGASGFVGSAIVHELRSRSYSINALINRKGLADSDDGVRLIKGDLFDPNALRDGMADCQAVIHLVGIIRQNPARGMTFERIHYEGTKRAIEATKAAGIKRYIQMSALGVRPDAVSQYHRTKYLAEECVRASDLDWTIFRPSLIHGEKGEFMQMETKWARRKAPPFLFMPYFGAGVLGLGGAGKLQPIFVGDVARLFADAVERPETAGEVYPIAGLDELTWPQLHHVSAQEIVGTRRPVIAIPVWLAKLLARISPATMLPFNLDQVLMSQEDNTTDLKKVIAAFGFTPQSFSQSLHEYAGKM